MRSGSPAASRRPSAWRRNCLGGVEGHTEPRHCFIEGHRSHHGALQDITERLRYDTARPRYRTEARGYITGKPQDDTEGPPCAFGRSQDDTESLQRDIGRSQDDIESLQCDIGRSQDDIEGLQCDTGRPRCRPARPQCITEPPPCMRGGPGGNRSARNHAQYEPSRPRQSVPEPDRKACRVPPGAPHRFRALRQPHRAYAERLCGLI